jgi:ubiquinone/menaquinone biosynthesis C-methylase UbiE
LNDTLLAEYYANRATEYERIYEKPKRQRDLETLRTLFRKQIILEIACSTGYWTQVAAQITKAIVATDVNERVLQIARGKRYICEVSFRTADAFRLPNLSQKKFTAGLAATWWSHLRKAQSGTFLASPHRALTPGALVVLMDNRCVSGGSTSISPTDSDGNTYQKRRLNNGSEYEVLKNFPQREDMNNQLRDFSTDLWWTELDDYWFLTYRTKP